MVVIFDWNRDITTWYEVIPMKIMIVDVRPILGGGRDNTSILLVGST